MLTEEVTSGNTDNSEPDLSAEGRQERHTEATNLLSDENSLIESPLVKVESKQMIKSASTRVITADTTHLAIEPSHVIEYEWPPKSGERFFIQEQIAELLDIKSFKRKYPELTRRVIESKEKEHLLAFYKLSSAISENQLRSLTALRAVEIHELMAADYPVIYSEYQKAAADKVKSQMAERQKHLDAIKFDTSKMEQLRKNAIKSAYEFNKEMNAIKLAERRHFWDVQTSIIQSKQNKWKRMCPERTKPGPYPVALVIGQYQQYFKKFTPDELRCLPLQTVLDYDNIFPPKRESSPPPITVCEDELNPTGVGERKDVANHREGFVAELPRPVCIKSGNKKIDKALWKHIFDI